MNNVVWLKANLDNTGLYRCSYPANIWASLTTGIKAQLLADATSNTPFSELDRAGLMNDALVLASAIPKAGSTSDYLSYTLAFELAKVLEFEKSYVVWMSALTEFNKLANLLAEEPCYANYGIFLRSLLSNLIADLQWQPRDDENPNRRLLRTAILGFVADFDDSNATLTVVNNYFNNYLSTKSFESCIMLF